MQIITPGNPKGARTCRATCPACGCVFEFGYKEARMHYDSREGDTLQVSCPQQGCGTTVWKDPDDHLQAATEALRHLKETK